MSARDEIRLLASGLAVGSNMRVQCPSCHGGQSGEHTLSVRRYPDGLKWLCFRASCCERGSTQELSEPVGDMLPLKPALKPFTGPLHPLEEKDTAYFVERFKLDADITDLYVRRTGRGEYAFNVNDPLGRTRGVVIRQPIWGGLPKAPRDAYSDPSMPKALTYMHAEGPVQACYLTQVVPVRGGHVVLVEDQVSAMRAAQAGVESVALLGTTLNAAKVREIAQRNPKEVIIALDADATSTAFQLAQTWGLAFRRTRVALLERDLKDEPSDGDVLDALGL